MPADPHRLTTAVRLPRVEDFPSTARGARTTSRVGVWLGVSFGVCFVTGVFSHYMQEVPGPGWLPTRPVNLYRVTQAVHVSSGYAAVPLLLVKLWSVYPRLFRRLDLTRTRTLLLDGLERASIAVLVAGATFQLATGVANVTQWYAWQFFSFRSAHYAVAWVTVGALLVHIAVKLPVIRSALGGPLEAAEPVSGAVAEPAGASVSRRAVLRSTWVAVGAAVLTTAGAAVPGLRRVSVFAVRTGDGPQGVPVNGPAALTGVTARARDPGWRLQLVRGDRTAELSRADLEAMPQHTVDIPIACVEGWSAAATWRGVRVRDVLAMLGAPPDSRLAIESLQEGWSDDLPPQYAADDLTLLALRLNGETLSLDHGYPCRLIAPARPGVSQTKWLRRLEVVS